MVPTEKVAARQRPPASVPDAMELRHRLLTARNPDGGWPYQPGKQSRIEPTCWALLALARLGDQASSVDTLRAWPRRDGWLVDVVGAPPNQAFNALAAFTLIQNAPVSPADPLVMRLVASKGMLLPQSDISRQDNSLQGWSWVDGTASWVEPTAWSLLLLKKLRKGGVLPRDAEERITIADRMLLDRACKAGGWNYGNKYAFGQDLWPYVPTTALALLALQDRRRDATVQRSLEQLQKDVPAERSAFAHALAVICLQMYDVNTDVLRRNLLNFPAAGSEPSATVAGAPGNLLSLAMTVFALADDSHASNPFRL